MSTVTILDGGMGKELRRIGAPFRQPEWSALALLEAPEYVGRAHRNFIDAGADVIITNTYALVPFHIGSDRFEARAAELAGLAATTARTASDDANDTANDAAVLVAGSLPPLFGSYEPDNFRPEEAPGLWRVLIEAQADHVDLWVGETLSSIAEARVLVATLDSLVSSGVIEAKPIWLSFTLTDHRSMPVEPDGNPEVGPATLRSGESMASVVELLDDVVGSAAGGGSGRVEAVLFNCSQPEVMTPALTEIGALMAASGTGSGTEGGTTVRLGVYANAFPPRADPDDGYAANGRILEGRGDLTPTHFAAMAAEWVDAGATIVGGCCDIYPDHIASLASAFGSRVASSR